MNAVHGLLAAGQGGGDPNAVSPGLLGFLAPFVLAIAAIFLFRSMTRHLRKVDRRAAQGDADRAPGPAGEPVDGRSDEPGLEDPDLPEDDDGRSPPAR